MRNEKAMVSEEMWNSRNRADQINSSGKIQQDVAWAHARKEMQRSTSIQEAHGRSK